MNEVEISVIVPVVSAHGDLAAIHREFAAAFASLGRTHEFLFVVDGGQDAAFESIKALRNGAAPVRALKLSRPFGESLALLAGLANARGRYIFTVPAYPQVEPSGVSKIWEALAEGYDLVIARRHPRTDSTLRRLRSRLFHWVVSKATSVRFRDVGCGLRGMKRAVLEELNLYGGLHRFIPVLAHKCGFRIREVDVPQAREQAWSGMASPRNYGRYLLDLLTILLVTKFTMMPLRFFGGIAAIPTLAGLGITGYMGISRLLGYGPIAQRPLLLLGILLLALGVQIISMGLICEIIVFTHAREMREHRIEEVLE